MEQFAARDLYGITTLKHVQVRKLKWLIIHVIKIPIF